MRLMASNTDPLNSDIASAAAGPAEVSGDAGSVRQQPLQDLVAADRYLSQAAGAKAGKAFGLRITKLIPPGPVGNVQGDGSQGMV